MFQREPTVQTIFNDWLWKASTLTWNKRLLTDVNNYRHLENDFIHGGNETDKRTSNRSDQLYLTNNRRTSNRPIWLPIDGWPMTDDKLNTILTANTIMAKRTNHFQRTKLITPSTGKHYSLDSEDDFCSGCRNVSLQRQFFSELH